MRACAPTARRWHYPLWIQPYSQLQSTNAQNLGCVWPVPMIINMNDHMEPLGLSQILHEVESVTSKISSTIFRILICKWRRNSHYGVNRTYDRYVQKCRSQLGVKLADAPKAIQSCKWWRSLTCWKRRIYSKQPCTKVLPLSARGLDLSASSLCPIVSVRILYWVLTRSTCTCKWCRNSTCRMYSTRDWYYAERSKVTNEKST